MSAAATAEFSGDESFLFVVSSLFGFIPAFFYYRQLIRAPGLGFPRGQRLTLALVPPAGLGIVLVVLLCFSAREVRSSGMYILLFLTVGLAWMMLSGAVFDCLGLSSTRDAIEQRNPAAIIAFSGATFAVSLTYAGGNIGEGATVNTTIFASLLATAGLFLLWLLLELASDISLAIVEHRDIATGCRFAGFLVAAGLMLGRAVAGDWHSTAATVKDFAWDGWPAVVLAVIAAGAERKLRPSLANPIPAIRSRGILPAVLYLAIAVVDLICLGKWK